MCRKRHARPREVHNAVIANVLTEDPDERRQCEYLDSHSPERAP